MSPLDSPKITQSILLDSCIIQYSSDSYRSLEFMKYLYALTTRGFSLSISEFTFFELLRGIPTTKKENILIEKLLLFGRFAVTNKVLVAAAQLITLYNAQKIPPDQIQDGDLILAATSILEGAPILTANVNDFPRPFFDTLEHQLIHFNVKNNQQMIVTNILQPNIQIIQYYFSRRPSQ
jgi:predicted nucleic acid-binding protein